MVHSGENMTASVSLGVDWFVPVVTGDGAEEKLRLLMCAWME